MSSSLGKVWTEAIASDVLHLMFVGHGGNGALRVFARKLLVEKDEIGEPPPDFA